MTDNQTEQAVAVATPNGKAKAGKKKAAPAAKPKKVSDHPKYAEMIKEALASLKERGGSSRQALLKYIANNYKLGTDEKSINAHLKVALRSGVKNGTLKQSKGVGASGSFKLGNDKEVKEVKPKKAAEKVSKAKPAAAKPAARKPKAAAAESPKKPVKKAKAETEAKVKKPKAAASPKKPKSPAKPKAAAKTAKPKSPKKEVKKAAPKPKKAKAAASPKAVKKTTKPDVKPKKTTKAAKK